MFVCCLWAGAVQAEPGVLVFGGISDNPRQDYEQLKPLLDYVVPRLQSAGIHSGRIQLAQDAAQMRGYLQNGRVDWAIETPGEALPLLRDSVAGVLLATEQEGVRREPSVVFVRRDSGLQALADLRGHRIAFLAPNSTSAFLLPAATMREAGLPLVRLDSPIDPIRHDGVAYAFAYTLNNLVGWVDRGLVDAGAVGELDWQALQRDSDSVARKLVAIHSTPALPHSLQLVGAGMDPKLATQLRAVLLAASADADGREALRLCFRSTGFYEPDAETRAELQRLQRDLAGLDGRAP